MDTRIYLKKQMVEYITSASASISAKTFLIHAGAAFCGAVSHALNAHRNGKSKTFIDFVSLIFISSFTGSMFFIAGFHFLGGDSYLTIVLGGSGGWLGVEGMSFLITVLKKWIKKSVEANLG